MRGVVKWFDANRGYGFILPEEGGADIFLHRRVLQASAGLRRLEPGQRVEFDVEETPQGRKITRISLIATDVP
jgi:CspA family cold shock protein